MSAVEPVSQARAGMRVAIAVFSILSIVVGVLMLMHPVTAGASIGIFGAVMIGIYSVVAGIAIAVGAFFTEGLSFWSRVLRLLLGVIAVIAGVIVLMNPEASGVGFIVFAVVMIGALWLVEGVVTLVELKQLPSKGWGLFYGIISILAGISLLVSPIGGAAALVLVLGITAVVWGIIGVVAAIRG